MAKRKAFGISRDLKEGISQTVAVAKNNIGQLRYEIIPLSKIKFDPENPRKLAILPSEVTAEDKFLPTDPLYERKKKELESLRSLANSIKKTGVRNAIEIYKDGVDYRLISGERRVLASQLAGKEDIQARVLDSKPSDFDVRYLQWIENIEREDLSLWERIQNVRQLITAYTNEQHVEVTATLLKDILGCSLPHAMTYLSVISAPPDVLSLLMNNTLTNLEKAAFLAKIDDSVLRQKLINKCTVENLSLAALRKIIHEDQKVINTMKKLKVKNSRATKRVALGFTNEILVVKHLLDLVKTNSSSDQLETLLTKIDWNNYSSVSKGFQLIIKSLERSALASTVGNNDN